MGMMRARWYTANKHAVYASRGVRRPLFVCRRTVVVGGVVVVVLVVGTQCECAARMRWILHTHTQQQQNKCDVSDTPKTNTHSDTHTDLGGFGGVRRTTEIREWCFGVNTVLTRFRVCVCVCVWTLPRFVSEFAMSPPPNVRRLFTHSEPQYKIKDE